MKNFEYACPTTEAEAIGLLNGHNGRTAVLAGGLDLMRLLQADLAAPERVVDVRRIASLSGIRATGDGVLIGALATLDELRRHPLLEPYSSVRQVADNTHAVQIQVAGTLAGDLCHAPNCWYFRNGYGLLAMEKGESLPAAGENQYHAILGNQGPAKFVSASRFAPALIAWGARLRLAGPRPDQETWIDVADFFVTPKSEQQGTTVLQPGQLITHVWLPAAQGMQSASYEVMPLQGLDWPLAAAAATLELDGSLVRGARIVLGHVAPVPWISPEAANLLAGRELTPDAAEQAGHAALAGATPLSKNGYKVQLARTAVKRALLQAAGMTV